MATSDCRPVSIPKKFPKEILRIKGCVQLTGNPEYTYFERVPSGEIIIRPFNGIPPIGTKLLTIGLGSEEVLLQKAIAHVIEKATHSTKN